MGEVLEMLSDLEAEIMKLRKEIEHSINIVDGKNIGTTDALALSHKFFMLESLVHKAWAELLETNGGD